MKLLEDLLWRIKGGRHGWPNATIFTYSLDDKGKWAHCQHQKNIDSQRVLRQVWRKEIGEAAVEKQKKEETIKKEKEESIQAKKAKLDKQKRDLLEAQDSRLVVDRETNEIVTFGEFQKLLKARYAKEFQTTEKPAAKRRRRW
ncbi:hypothetical protein OCU04_009102 [Sclerotinia nivalis]|uniref:Uncharacterized protein n=1 Tax=Sclerotinia nivalis TaxID=352851 RepID=A0A9X0AGW1_9HELO|nr:hypothetical protein OCU04_009102 [Sclerotinia nivalis]